MNYSSKKEQVKIYVGKFFREFKNKSKLTILLGSIAIPIIIRLITGAEGFLNANDDGRTAAFILTSACLWLGIFNSITNICKEKDIVKHEYREGLDMGAYIGGHLIFQGFVVLVEALIMTVILSLLFFRNFNNFFYIILLFISLFLLIYAADALGILISSLVRNVEEAMTVMPFVLLVELVLSGFIQLKAFYLQILSFFMVSKNGLDTILRLSEIPDRSGVYVSFAGLEFNIYDKVLVLPISWLMLIGLSLVFAILAEKILSKNINK